MKKITIVLALLISALSFAQQGINYKALIKDGDGNVVASTQITLQFIIYQGAGETNSVYQETHMPTTDANGIIIINIGEGVPDSGIFADIDWGSDDHYLNTQINTGAGLQDMGTTGFKAVPYAISLTGGIDKAYIEALETQIAILDARLTVFEPAAIGNFRAGGVVFWVDPTDNTHGLVCALEDQSTGIQWWNGTQVYVDTTASAIGTGSANTDAIIAAQGPVATNYAAGLARAYTGGDFNDWFLPSKDELNQMYLNRVAINTTAVSNGGTEFANVLFSAYWSSTENDIWAYKHEFGSNEQYEWFKFSTEYVCAVRAF